MPAIQTIVETYVKFEDERALLALKAHRLKLLAMADESNPFFSGLRNQCLEDISAIEAGLIKLRPPVLQPLPLSMPANVALPASSSGDFGLAGDPRPPPTKANAPASVKIGYSPFVQTGIQASPSSPGNGASPPAKTANAVLHNRPASDFEPSLKASTSGHSLEGPASSVSTGTAYRRTAQADSKPVSAMSARASSPLTDEANPSVARPTVSVEQLASAKAAASASNSEPLSRLGPVHRSTTPTDSVSPSATPASGSSSFLEACPSASVERAAPAVAAPAASETDPMPALGTVDRSDSASLSSAPTSDFSSPADESSPSVPQLSASDRQPAPPTVAATASESVPLSSPVTGVRPASSDVLDDPSAAPTTENSAAAAEPDNPSSDLSADNSRSETAGTPARSSTTDAPTVSQASALLLSLIESDPPSPLIPNYFVSSAPASSPPARADNAQDVPQAGKLAHSLTASTLLAASLAAKGVSGGGKL